MRAPWEPGRIWEGEDAYIIGGGPSLRVFDWDLLRGKKTVGCNSAFILGADVCKVVIFADDGWWLEIGQRRLPEYGGMVVGCCPSIWDRRDQPPPWVLRMDRQEGHVGLGRPGTFLLGFNGNTGCLAINLALLLGARRVFLLGYDMKMEGDRPNWHDVRHEPGRPDVYANFKRSMDFIVRDLPIFYPGREVINLSDVSELQAFPKQSLVEHFRNRHLGLTKVRR